MVGKGKDPRDGHVFTLRVNVRRGNYKTPFLLVEISYGPLPDDDLSEKEIMAILATNYLGITYAAQCVLKIPSYGSLLFICLYDLSPLLRGKGFYGLIFRGLFSWVAVQKYFSNA